MTICAHERTCLFGEVSGGEVILNPFGIIVREEWLQTSTLRSHITLDQFTVMPNHVHGIVCIAEDLSASGGAAARKGTFGKPVAGALPTIVGAFKSAVTKRVNRLRDTPGAPVWQRNFYEHIIRHEAEHERIAEYISTNPKCWHKDDLHP